MVLVSFASNGVSSVPGMSSFVISGAVAAVDEVVVVVVEIVGSGIVVSGLVASGIVASEMVVSRIVVSEMVSGIVTSGVVAIGSKSIESVELFKCVAAKVGGLLEMFGTLGVLEALGLEVEEMLRVSMSGSVVVSKYVSMKS